jgi:outer membrane immunogenic protein
MHRQERTLVHQLRTLRFWAVVALMTVLFPLGNAQAGIPFAPNPGNGANSGNASSWLAGAHAGYNWQRGGVVFGFETDFQGTHLNSSANSGLNYQPAFPAAFFLLPNPSDFATSSSVIDWYGTVRGRLGWAFGPWLLYGTAGFAYGDVSLNSSFKTVGILTSAQTSEIRPGVVFGGGVDYQVSPNLIFNILYQHVDLGSLSVSSSGGPVTFPGPYTVTTSQLATAHARFDAVMAGLTWRFAPAGAYGSWVGGYFGGQGGGAWGSNTSAVYTSSETFPPGFSDARLKRDITLVGVRNDGLGVYSYKYLWSETVFIGVLAQEVALIRPDAVGRDELTGFLTVDYNRLGMPLMMLQ